MEHYQLINKELSLEVQKLRLHLKEYDRMCAELRNENRELQAQNAIMKSYISQNFETFSSFSNKFTNDYVQLCARGIKISLPPPGNSNRNSTASSHRSSLRNSVPLSSPRRSASPNRYRSSPEVFYQRTKRLPYSGNAYRAQVAEAKKNSQSPENTSDDSYQEQDDDERCDGGEGPSQMPNNLEAAPENPGPEQLQLLHTICEESQISNTTQYDKENDRSALKPLTENSPVYMETPRVSNKRPSSSSDQPRKFRKYSDKENIEDSMRMHEEDESFRINHSLLSKASSTPLPLESRRSSTAIVKIEKIRLSSEDVAEYQEKFCKIESLVDNESGAENSTQKEKLTRSKKKISVARRSSGRPKRSARPREGSLVENKINTKLRRSK